MYDALKRLIRTGAAYQVGEVLAKGVAVLLLPLYTRYLAEADYGTADLLLTTVILFSFVVRLGIVEAFVRHWYLHDDEAGRQRVARAATGYLLLATTACAILIAVFAAPLSRFVLGSTDTTLMLLVAIGLWSYTNLELANGLLRVEERASTFMKASLTNVGLTIAMTFTLVVGFDAGAKGMLAGNFFGTTVVLLGLLWIERDRVGLRIDRAALRPMLRFGLPTVPAEVSVFALNIVDRLYLYRHVSKDDAGLFSLAVKLAMIVIFVTRAFQYAWPPLAYSIRSDDEARRLYAFVTTYYVLATGMIVAGLALLGRWAVRLLAAPGYFPAHEALPWVALGWALYGLVLILIVMAGRAQVTTRNFPAAICGLAANVVLLLVLVPPLGIAGAGLALVGAYVVMLVVLYALTRNVFVVPFEWLRLGHLLAVVGGATVAGELLLPTSGALGFVSRALVLCAIPGLLWVTRFFHAAELARLRQLAGALRRRRGAEDVSELEGDGAISDAAVAPNPVHAGVPFEQQLEVPDSGEPDARAGGQTAPGPQSGTHAPTTSDTQTDAAKRTAAADASQPTADRPTPAPDHPAS